MFSQRYFLAAMLFALGAGQLPAALAQSSAGSANKPAATVAKRELQLVTVTQINGKPVSQRSAKFCVPVGNGFAAHHLISHDPKDTPCTVAQAPSGPGSFFRFSCDNGATTIGGSIRQMKDDGFVSSYVESNADGQRSLGTVGSLGDECS